MRAARRRGLTEHDRAAWASYVLHVVPLRDSAAPEEVPEVSLPAVPPQSPQSPQSAPLPPASWFAAGPAAPPAPARTPPLAIGAHPPGVDNATWARFRTGKTPALRTLDLHGRTAQRAYVALHAFLNRAHADRVRCVEVITGRGAGEGGVIRRELPLWLNLGELRPLVLAAAHPHAANPGSVRLLLRRIRGD